MSDLIRRRDAVSRMFDLLMVKFQGQRLPTWNDVYQAMNDIPSAEPERKKGKWIDGLPYINSHWWVCSVCHVSAPENHTGYNFCPSCGADMRGE